LDNSEFAKHIKHQNLSTSKLVEIEIFTT